MGTVKIIGQNSGLTIRMDCRQWQDQAVELEAKLRLLKTRDGHPAEVFFDSDPGAERLKQLFEILQSLKIHGHMEEDHGGIVQYFEALADVVVKKMEQEDSES